ncbi:protein timeless [Lepeophtheirus salmonis]|uniref:protein timeless n=1 Tax=Lepeophtheirus salmonis TaxID=72036 RepID=UPI003AF35CC2
MSEASSPQLEKTVREIFSYSISAPPGDSKIDLEVSAGSSSDDNDQSASVPRHKRKTVGPHVSASEKREIRRKKILKIMYNSMKKRREQSMVDEEDVSILLTEFTISFILRGYGNLIQNLRLKLMSQKPSSTFTNTHSRFLWLITFFMSFVEDLEVKLPEIEPVFSPEIMSYIVFEGLQTFENLEIESKPHLYNDTVVKTQGRRLHLVVSAIKQILITINWMDNNTKDSETRLKIHRIILLLMEMSNLRQFHLLLIWKFNLSYQTRCFINDVVMCNHKLLLLFEKVNSSDKFIKEHLEQFATVEVMRKYGYCLETFESNTVSLNEAIFTMIHHVSVDLNAHEALLIPEILNTFSNLLENDLFVGDRWSDLIDYVVQRLMNTIHGDPINVPPRFVENVIEEDQSSQYFKANDQLQLIPLRNNKKINNLQWYYSECKNSQDPVGSIIDLYKEAENEILTRESVLQGLLSYGIITHAQYIKLAIVKPTLTKNNTSSDATRSMISELGSQRGESESGQDNLHIADENMQLSFPSSSEKVYVEEIEGIKDLLLSQGKEYLIHWLQEQILHAILVKTHAKSKSSVEWKEGVLEPIAYYSVFWNEGIPMVPWSLKEESGLKKIYFLILLKKIGIYLPAERYRRFPRIPFEWSIDHLQDIYKKLASGDDLSLGTKFTRASKQIANFAKPKLQNITLWNEGAL